MPILKILRMPDGSPIGPDIPGTQCTITIPDLPPPMGTCEDLVTWLRPHPDLVSDIERAFQVLLAHKGPETDPVSTSSQ